MAISNPLLFAGYKIGTKKEQDQFLSALAGYLNTLQNSVSRAQFLASVLNGSGLLSADSRIVKTVNLGTVSTAQTVPVDGASAIAVNIRSVTAGISLALNLTHIADGASFAYIFTNNSAGNDTVFIRGTNASGAAISCVATTTGAITDMVGVGILTTTNTALGFSGVYNGAANSLELVAS